VLTGYIAERLKDLLFEKAEQMNVVIEALEITPALPCTALTLALAGSAREGKCACGASVLDHVHLFVSTDPTEAPQRLANQFKVYTSRMLRKGFAPLYSRMPTLWSRSYYVGSIGHGSEDTVKRTIEA
jgi:putative transposase